MKTDSEERPTTPAAPSSPTDQGSAAWSPATSARNVQGTPGHAHAHAPMGKSRSTHQAQSGRKLPTPAWFTLFHVVSVVLFALLLILRPVFRDSNLIYSYSLPLPTPLFSPTAEEAAPVCENQLFPTSAPVSVPLDMALAKETKSIAAEFEYSDHDINVGVKEFLRQMAEGLGNHNSSLSQIPTYVTSVPNGTEKGLYLAVDLGGTNLRVCSVRLNGDNTFNLTYSKAAIPKELMVAKTSKELFKFIAHRIDDFLKEHHSDRYESHVRRRETMSAPEGFRDENIFHLGFTFSFPVRQAGINKGYLIRWTKGFDIPDAIGKDVCALLQQEIDALRLPVKVAALVNDTVGTLMARSYTSPSKEGTLLGAIFGTGTNGAYVEKLSNVMKTIESGYDTSTGQMVMNTEWGSFDNQLNVLPNTSYDIQINKESVNPGFHMFEKRVSGMFLGEILRLVLVSMLEKKVALFHDDNSDHNDWKSTTTVGPNSGIYKKWGLDSAIMSVAALDNTPDLGTLRQELESKLDVYSPSLEDAQAFKAISVAIGRRAARLSAVALGGIVLNSGHLTDPEWAGKDIDIGVDGSLVEHYPEFRSMIYEALEAIEGIGKEGAKRIQIGIVKDGSGVGAALIALVAAGMEKTLVSEALKEVRKEAALHKEQNKANSRANGRSNGKAKAKTNGKANNKANSKSNGIKTGIKTGGLNGLGNGFNNTVFGANDTAHLTAVAEDRVC